MPHPGRPLGPIFEVKCCQFPYQSPPLHVQGVVGPNSITVTISIIPAPKTLLRHHQPELVQYINLESLVPYLNQQQLLTDDENDTLLNLYLSNRIRVIKLLQFMETKGDEGFQRFLKAIAYEQDHMGHAEIAKLLAPYRKLVCM